MFDLNLGRVGLNPRPDFQSGQEARPLDLVTFDGSLWICLSSTTDAPDKDNPAWMLVVENAPRLRLQGETTLYVHADGHDANDGFSPDTALATMAGLIRRLNALDPAGHRVVARFGAGTFETVTWNVSGYATSMLYITGEGPDRTFFQNAWYIQSPLYVSGITALASITANTGALVSIRDTSNRGYVRLQSAALRTIHSGILHLHDAVVEFAGNADCGLYADRGTIDCVRATFKALEGASFARAFAVAFRNGAINFYQGTFQGTAGGRKYVMQTNGAISGDGANAALDLLLGDAAGLAQSPGYASTVGVAQG